MNLFQSNKIKAFTSVITLVEVIPNPAKTGNILLVTRFLEFMRYGKNLDLIEISNNIAENAANLRMRYPYLKTMDALQISSAMDVNADVFITNDIKLKQVKDIKMLVLKDYR